MRYLKTYELFHPDSDLEEQIQDIVNDFTFTNSDNFGEIDECPFVNELSILHERDYIHEIYIHLKEDSYYNISKYTQLDVTTTYNRLIKKAEKKVLKYIKEDPSLYFKWKPNLKNIPDWLEKYIEMESAIDKYNL